MTSPPDRSLGEGELRLLDRLSSILGSLDSRQEVLENLMDLFLNAMEAERGLLLSFGKAGEATPLVTRNLEPDAIKGMTAGWSRSAVEEMAEGGTVVISEDVLNDKRFKNSESILEQNIQSLLCVPIRGANGGVDGAIYIDHRSSSRNFTERDVNFARALAELSAVTLHRINSLEALHQENTALRARAKRYEFDDIIGASEPMQALFEKLENALTAPANFAILLNGENGTGKTQIARLLHRQSDRRARPFVSFGAGSVPESLVEAELFGHKRGSFTGADSDRRGLIERADGGTLFLDDVNNLPLSVQPKLLAFLQEREYRPIGGDTKRADVRVVCATNVDLASLVEAKEFREDLWYRLNGIPLTVPPLRDREEDIPLLARHFLAEYSRAVAKEILGFTRTALAQMIAYSWPGNVRELMSEVVHAVTMTRGRQLDIVDFKASGLREVSSDRAPVETPLDLSLALDQTTRRVLTAALEVENDNISRAAKRIGVSRGKFYDLMSRVELRQRDRPPSPGKPASDS